MVVVVVTVVVVFVVVAVVAVAVAVVVVVVAAAVVVAVVVESINLIVPEFVKFVQINYWYLMVELWKVKMLEEVKN